VAVLIADETYRSRARTPYVQELHSPTCSPIRPIRIQNEKIKTRIQNEPWFYPTPTP
jgi:hypothetical protein